MYTISIFLCTIGPDQQEIFNQGNSYIDENFPDIDFIYNCRVIAEYDDDERLIEEYDIELPLTEDDDIEFPHIEEDDDEDSADDLGINDEL